MIAGNLQKFCLCGKIRYLVFCSRGHPIRIKVTAPHKFFSHLNDAKTAKQHFTGWDIELPFLDV